MLDLLLTIYDAYVITQTLTFFVIHKNVDTNNRRETNVLFIYRNFYSDLNGLIVRKSNRSLLCCSVKAFACTV